MMQWEKDLNARAEYEKRFNAFRAERALQEINRQYIALCWNVALHLALCDAIAARLILNRGK